MGGEASQPVEPTFDKFESDRNREINRMDQLIRSRIRSGVQYNMKVILRGERGSGKTSLWKRFQGMPFTESYQPTSEIQSATINWTFKNNSDNVKVEVWDVVDKAIKNSKKSEQVTTNGRNNIDLLDATIVDVYKDTQAVIFMVNPTTPQSLNYVRNKAQDVPLHISVMIVLGFKDLTAGEKAKSNNMSICITMSEILVLCSELREFRKERAADEDSHHQLDCFGIHCVEVSLLNCFGLQKLHKTAALRAQLQIAYSDMHNAVVELKTALKPLHDHEYEEFEFKYLARKRTNEVDPHLVADVEDTSPIAYDPQVEIYNSETDDLKDSLSSIQKQSHIDRHKSNDSKNSQGLSSKKQYVLKLNHDQGDVDPKNIIKSTEPGVSTTTAALSVSKKSQNLFEQEIERFRPSDDLTVAHLEGFLEPSDEEERRAHLNKQQIRRYVRDDVSPRQPKSIEKKDQTVSSESDDILTSRYQSSVYNTAKDGKSLRKAKPSAVTSNDRARSIKSIHSGKFHADGNKPNSSVVPDTDSEQEQQILSTAPSKSKLKKAIKLKKEDYDRERFPEEMDF